MGCESLDRNYRSTQPILAAANGVIELAAERFTKNLWTDRNSAERPYLVSVRDEADQARYVVECVLENREGGSGLKQQAILFRASHHSGPLEVASRRSVNWRAPCATLRVIFRLSPAFSRITRLRSCAITPTAGS